MPETPKRTIPGTVLRDYALTLGARPNVPLMVRCAYCDFEAEICWSLLRNQKVGWVGSPWLEWDHIHPEHLGGEATVDNLTLACRPCNRSKGHKTLSEWLCAR